MSPLRRPLLRGLSAAALVLVGAATTVGAAAPSAAAPAAATCGPAPEGRTAVAVVVDTGGAAPSSRCVVVPTGIDGYEVLRAGGHTLRIEAGFLCAIDGVPATGCGQDGGSTHFWSYWRAQPGGSWAFSRTGGGFVRMPARCAVEGWRWSSRAEQASPPRGMVPSVRCEQPPATTVPPVTARPTAPQTPPATALPPAPVAPAVDTPSGAGAGPAVDSHAGEAGVPVPADPAPEATSTTVAPDHAHSTEAADDAGDDDGTAEAHSDAERSVQNHPAGFQRTREEAAGVGGRSGSSPTGTLVGLGIVAALGAAAWGVHRSRVRRSEVAA